MQVITTHLGQGLVETLPILDAAGVDGAFMTSFSEPWTTFSDKPGYDLDMSALSLVKTYAARHGTTYPDMPWEPKEAFQAPVQGLSLPAACRPETAHRACAPDGHAAIRLTPGPRDHQLFD